MAVIIDGKELAKKIRANLKIECEELKKKKYKLKISSNNGRRRPGIKSICKK